jgi:hypothetical protein
MHDIKDNNLRQTQKMQGSIDSMGKSLVEPIVKKELDLFKNEQRSSI